MQPKAIKLQNQNFKIALYIRVSTEEQAENPEGSIRNQEDRLRDAVEYRNRNANYGAIVGVYTDAGISAKNMNRPALQRLLRDLNSGEVNLIIVSELSRLSRNTRDFIQIWDVMHQMGCRFSSLREDFDTTNAAGELVLFQLMNLAQFERRQTSERVLANFAARAKRGLYNGGPILVGYQRDPAAPGYLVIDAEMADVVRECFRTFLREGTLAKTAIWLNENGYRVKKLNEGGGRLRRLGHFTVTNVQVILRQRAYIGVKVFREKDELKESKGVWPAIIDELTFQRVGKMLSENRYRMKSDQPNKLPYFLTGRCFCLKCGDFMSGKSANGNGGKVGYYEHAWATNRDSTLTQKIFKCEPHRVPLKKLEPLVWEKFCLFLMDTKFVSEVFAAVLKFHEANPLRKERERLKAKITGYASQLDALAERLGEIPKGVSAGPIYKHMEKIELLKTENETELQRLIDGGANPRDRIIALEDFTVFSMKYRQLIKGGLSADQKKLLIKRFIHRVEVGVDSVNIHFIVDKDHYMDEAALEAASNQKSSFLKNLSSTRLTIGTGRGT